MPTQKTSTTLLDTYKRKAWRPDGPTNGHCRGSSTISGAGTTLKINLLFFRKTAPAKTRLLERRSVDRYTGFYYPLLNKWAERVRTITFPDELIFVEPIPNEVCSSPSLTVFAADKH
ncbi:glycoside hydrolase family 5 protein [Laccaria amethystina LaAM-08-1]|uniref:Unplaced genomic scaffold K443scaffold_795, whole genome shotgun sequence n=1 Tax=Laccaria amethystina LaAM-08-1 TaxID=1095629 RepID=A0A0C9WXB9_9AGAR|nr:glycoside hydrolase family 5 protein [Laccaria amethystina LaAM-08-1]